MNSYYVLGVMSGTSLDGIDIAEIQFHFKNTWTYQLKRCETIPYPKHWIVKLQKAHQQSPNDLEALNIAYTTYLAKCITNFIDQYQIKNLDAVCSHGHTVLHEPQNQYTLQIGNLESLAKLIKQNVVCDYRVQDVQLGGQGAPLVPIGDALLFSEYDACLNLGGFANISFAKKNTRIAFDNCPVNTVLNYYAQKLGRAFDHNGDFSRKGKLNYKLLKALNELDYYQKPAPKSLGIEWVKNTIIPLMESYNLTAEDYLHTFTNHVAYILINDIKKNLKQKEPKILVTGGGGYNQYLMSLLNNNATIKFELPSPQVIEFKEALIFGLLGVLKLRSEINVLASVTGSIKNHSSGKVFYYQFNS